MAVSVDFITCALSHYSWLTLVFPFPWTTTGRESYAVFLTLTRSVPNLRSTSSARRRKTRCLRREYEKLTNHMDMLCCRGFFFYLKSTRPRQEHNTGVQWSATKVSTHPSLHFCSDWVQWKPVVLNGWVWYVWQKVQDEKKSMEIWDFSPTAPFRFWKIWHLWSKVMLSSCWKH